MSKTEVNSDRKNLILLSLAKLLSGFAGYLYDIGIVIYLFDETQSVAVIGGFFISQLLPAFIILLSGQIIDRYNKKSLILCSNLAKVAIFLLLLLDRNIWTVYAATFLFNFLLEFEGNTFSSLMTNIFAKEKLLRAASAVNLLDSVSMLLAPVSASVIAARFSFNANLIFAILLSVLTAAVYLFIGTDCRSNVENCGLGGREGYLRMIRDKKMVTTVVFWNMFMLCIGVAAPLEISMIEDTLGMSSACYGIGNTVEGIGMIIASVFILGMMRKLKPNHIILLGLLSSAVSYLVIGASGNIWVYFIGACFVGMTSTFCPLGFKTEIQINSSPAVIGRTFTAARFTVLLSRIAGSFIVGPAAERVGIRTIYYCIAAILALAAVVYGRKAVGLFRRKIHFFP